MGYRVYFWGVPFQVTHPTFDAAAIELRESYRTGVDSTRDYMVVERDGTRYTVVWPKTCTGQCVESEIEWPVWTHD